jgi:hypothetical protein
MTDPPDRNRFVSQLLQQDEPMTDTAYMEYRMKLETALSQAERREKLTGIIAGAAFILALLLMFVGGSRVVGGFDPWSKDATILSTALGVVYALAAVTWPLAMAMYFSRFRPRVRGIKEQIRDTMLLGLQAEVAALRKQVGDLTAHISRNDS